MRRNTLVVVAAVGLLAGACALSAQSPAHATEPASPEKPAHVQLVDGSPSIEALIGRVLDALAKNDGEALRRARVTEDEYRNFVLPGGVEEGQSPKILDDESSKFAWGMINTNSIYAGQAIIKNFGGRRYTLKDVRYAKGQRHYAWYDSYNTTVLTLEDDTGGIRELTLGSIAQIDGQYKFVSLLGNK